MLLFFMSMGCFAQPQITGLDYEVNGDEILVTWNSEGDFQKFSVFLNDQLVMSVAESPVSIKVNAPGDYTIKVVGYLPGGSEGDVKTVQVNIPDAPCVPSFSIIPSTPKGDTYLIAQNTFEFKSSNCKLYINQQPFSAGTVYLEEGRYTAFVMCDGPFGKHCRRDFTILVDSAPPKINISEHVYTPTNRYLHLRIEVNDITNVTCTLKKGTEEIKFGKEGYEGILLNVLPNEAIVIDCTDEFGRKTHSEITVG